MSAATGGIRSLRPARSRADSRRVGLADVGRHAVLIVFSLAWLVPLYLVVINAFKPQAAILTGPFGLPWSELTGQFLWAAIISPTFNVVGAYGFTALLVVLTDVLVIAIAGPVAYVIARGLTRRHQALLFYFLLGTFIPGQAILIPVTSILRSVGLMGNLGGIVLFQTVGGLPVTIFLFVGFIRTIPGSIDEAAAIDGAGMLRRFWQIIFPLMRPIVATAIVLTSMGVWNDFVNPQIILGPLAPKTVTTGVYAAFGQYLTQYTVVFPDLLLALAPILVFFVLMQRHIVSGLTSGALKS